MVNYILLQFSLNHDWQCRLLGLHPILHHSAQSLKASFPCSLVLSSRWQPDHTEPWSCPWCWMDAPSLSLSLSLSRSLSLSVSMWLAYRLCLDDLSISLSIYLSIYLSISLNLSLSLSNICPSVSRPISSPLYLPVLFQSSSRCVLCRVTLWSRAGRWQTF